MKLLSIIGLALLLSFNMPGAGYSATILYEGEITNIIEYPSQPYANVGDDFWISVDYDTDTAALNAITLYLENWGEMYPTYSPFGDYNSPNDWCFQNTTTQWSLHGDIFKLVSDGFSCEITGQVHPTPEPATLALLCSGVLSLMGFRRKKALN